jgi:D-sedoheptulose 7-phosphate isomerase
MPTDLIGLYLAELETAVRNISRGQVRSAVDLLFQAWETRRTVFIIGNGGSAATASHMMNDLNKSTVVSGMARFRSIALTDNVPLMTAVGNDVDYAEVFVEPLRNLLQPADILVAISTSGNSPNIVGAVEYAQEQGAKVIGFCGEPGGKLAAMAHVTVSIPAGRIGQQEDGHMILDHVICAALRERIEQRAIGRSIGPVYAASHRLTSLAKGGAWGS